MEAEQLLRAIGRTCGAFIKAIVEGHGDEIHAYNAQDGRALFRVTLPITQVAFAGESPTSA